MIYGGHSHSGSRWVRSRLRELKQGGCSKCNILHVTTLALRAKQAHRVPYR